MARITVEDCKEKVTDRFKLVLFAAVRSKAINAGAEITIDKENKDKRRNKPAVVALREIAAGHVTVANLEKQLVKNLRTTGDAEPNVEDDVDSLNEGIDYIPSGLDLSINQDYSDLDSEMFTEVDSDETIKK